VTTGEPSVNNALTTTSPQTNQQSEHPVRARPGTQEQNGKFCLSIFSLGRQDEIAMKSRSGTEQCSSDRPAEPTSRSLGIQLSLSGWGISGWVEFGSTQHPWSSPEASTTASREQQSSEFARFMSSHSARHRRSPRV